MTLLFSPKLHKGRSNRNRYLLDRHPTLQYDVDVDRERHQVRISLSDVDRTFCLILEAQTLRRFYILAVRGFPHQSGWPNANPLSFTTKLIEP